MPYPDLTSSWIDESRKEASENPSTDSRLTLAPSVSARVAGLDVVLCADDVADTLPPILNQRTFGAAAMHVARGRRVNLPVTRVTGRG